MNETDLNKLVVEKYMLFNDLLLDFLKKNNRKGRIIGNPNRGQGKILKILHENNAISQKDLVKELDIKPQSASELIRKLERKGFIKRTASLNDRRNLIVELTKSGRVVANECNDFKPVFLDGLNTKEKEQFNQILDKLISEAQSENFED